MKHVSSVSTLTVTLPVLLVVMLLGSCGQILMAAETSIGGSGASNIRLDQPGSTSSSDKTATPSTGGQIVVKLSAPLDSSLLLGLDNSLRVIAALEHSYTYLMQIAEDVYYDSAKTSAVRTLEAMSVQPNYPINEIHPVQGSYPFSDVNNNGIYHNQPASTMLDLNNCQQVVNGSGVKIAIIDGGVDFSHSALENSVESGYDYIDKDSIAFDEAGGITSGHGTFVAGVVHLAAPMATIVSYRIINADGQGDGFSMARAIERAVDDGCRIINISLVLINDHLAVNEAISYAVSQGVTIVAAAGNDNNSIPIFPAANANVISVAAVDTVPILSAYSNYGPSIDICAPGNIIYSAFQNDIYAWWSGTSFATPFVTGQVALMMQYAPALDPLAIRDLIISTGTNIDAYNSGFIGFLGGGLANPARALMALGAIAGNCCTDPGDINNNGISYELSDAAVLENALAANNPTLLGTCLGNADVNLDCIVDVNDYHFINRVIAGDTLPFPNCASCSTYVFVPGITGQDNCCTLPGDINSNGLAFEVADSILLYNALSTGDIAYLQPCIGNADITGDCLIDTVDRAFMRGIITGEIDIYVYPPVCSQCQSYQFIPDTGGSTGPCCTLRGDINNNTIPFEFSEMLLLLNALRDNDTTYLPCMGNADIDGNCIIDNNDLTLMNYFITIDSFPYLACPSCQSYTFVPGIPGSGACCTLPGDINNNGIAFEFSEMLLLMDALRYDDTTYLGSCIGNADIDGNCTIDFNDLTLMNNIIIGDTVMYPTCGSCQSYTLVPGIPSGPCCTLPGDINSNGLSFEVADSILLYDALATGDTNYLAPCIGNADLNSDCLINASDLEIMRSAITTDTTRNITCASCQSYTLVTGVPPQECWTMAGDINDNGISFEAADSILLYNALHTGNINYLQPCIGNADITFNCQIDTFDLRLMRQIITGDTIVYLDSNFCRSYEFIPDTAGMTVDSAYVYATPWRFNAPVGSEIIQSGNLVVGATGASKFFNVSYLNTPNFIRLMDTVGFTNDSIFFEVASSLLPPGSYVDSLIVYVNGATNSPLIARIYLMVDSVYGPSNQAWAHGIPHLTFIVPEGTDTVITRQLVIGSDNVPKPYTISIPDPPEFLQFSQTSGLTIDTIDFSVVCTSNMAPGYHTDSFLIYVDSVTNSPLRMDVLLIIEADTVFTWDSTSVVPDELSFQIPYGSYDTVHSSVLIYSSNAPAPCSSSVRNKPDRFIYLPIPYGWTPDTLDVAVFAGNKTPGTYHDTVWVNVTGCYFTYLFVNLEILGSAKSGTATELGLANYPNPFNSSTEMTCTFPSATRATLKVYDILGREVITLVDGYVSAGPFRAQWNGTDRNGQPVASGIYLYRLQAGGESVTKRMILLK